jgi:hypothetical protein
MGWLDTLLSLIYEPRYLMAQGSGGLDPLALVSVLWATTVLAAGTYLTRRRPRQRGWLGCRAGYWAVAVGLAICRVTGSAPLASPLWMWVSLLGGVYVLSGDLLGLRLRDERSQSENTAPLRTDAWLRRGALVLLVITLAWSAVEYLRHRTAGVSGSDPFCYVQMAVDFDRHGTFAHRFPLAARVAAWGLPPAPTLPVGYWLPVGQDAAITSYSFGFPLLLAAGYALGGEGALWLVTPLLALAAVGATWALAQVLFDGEPRGHRWAIGAVAVWIVATSYTQMRLAIVPMSDVPTQLFSTLALALAWTAERKRRVMLSALSGAALGVAYLVRHTSLALLAPLAVILMQSQPAKGGWWRRQGALGLTAAFVALPDLLYHQRWLGGFWRGENPEIGRQVGLAHVWSSLAAFVEYLAYPGEFGWLLPLLLLGTYVLWRKRRAAFAVLITWTLALVAIYAPVHTTALFQNGARYLLPAFPALALTVGGGVVHLIGRSYEVALRRVSFATEHAESAEVSLNFSAPSAFSAVKNSHCAGPAIVMVLALVVPFVLRTPLHKPLLNQYPTFGYLSSSQRAEFIELQAAIPEGAVVACGDDSGPLFWYTSRATVRPQGWTQDEFTRFMERVIANGVPVYLLNDGSLDVFVRNHPFQLVDRFTIGDPERPVEDLYFLTLVHQGGER